VNKVCGGVWRAATEVEEKENKVFLERTVPLGATEQVIRQPADHLLSCCLFYHPVRQLL
jgi:hypothetical protein